MSEYEYNLWTVSNNRPVLEGTPRNEDGLTEDDSYLVKRLVDVAANCGFELAKEARKAFSHTFAKPDADKGLSDEKRHAIANAHSKLRGHNCKASAAVLKSAFPEAFDEVEEPKATQPTTTWDMVDQEGDRWILRKVEG